MRLSAFERLAIVESVASLIGKVQAELILFGSRTNDKARGGDIDVLLRVQDAQSREDLVDQRPQILAEISARLGDRKIDLSVATVEQTLSRPFYQVALRGSVLLARWPADQQTAESAWGDSTLPSVRRPV